MEKGGISVQTENIFPVIKRWLYSDKDIFLREVVSNACDAITKHKRLVSLGNASDEEKNYKVTVKLDKEKSTVTISDNGIGMTSDEVKKYINQIALSGALDFIEKYESKEANSSGIIGHFGLGFYSVFMISDSAEIITKSYTDSPAVHWTCDEAGNFEMEDTTRDSGRGTDIILHVSEAEKEYLDSDKLKGILEKYCSFMPYSVMFNGGEKDEQINDTDPIWQKNPNDVTNEQYVEFYHKITGDYGEPLMYVHIQADFPLNFKGILYFPKIKPEFDSPDPKVQLYYNQVYVADNIKELLPEYLIYAKGVLDCPELPLNVSRSYLQTNTYCAKVALHIGKKIADKYNNMFANGREELEKIYPELSTYIEFACLKDEKFYSCVKDNVLFRLTDGKTVTLDEYRTDESSENKKDTVYYVNDKKELGYYVSAYNEKGIKVVEAPKIIDSSYMQFLEQKEQGLKFKRIDADIDALGEKAENDDIKSLFVEVTGIEKDNVKLADLGENSSPALLTYDEESRRFSDMMKAYSFGAEMPSNEKPVLTVNITNPGVKKLEQMDDEKKKLTAKYIYMSALLLARKLSPEEMKEYVELGGKLIQLI